MLYGSVARGNFRPDSDIDLLLVFEELPPHRFARYSLIHPLLQEVERSTPQDGEGGQRHRFSTILKTREEARYTSRYYILESGEKPVFLQTSGLAPHKGCFLGEYSPPVGPENGFLGASLPQNQIRQSPVT